MCGEHTAGGRCASRAAPEGQSGRRQVRPGALAPFHVQGPSQTAKEDQGGLARRPRRSCPSVPAAYLAHGGGGPPHRDTESGGPVRGPHPAHAPPQVDHIFVAGDAAVAGSQQPQPQPGLIVPAVHGQRHLHQVVVGAQGQGRAIRDEGVVVAGRQHAVRPGAVEGSHIGVVLREARVPPSRRDRGRGGPHRNPRTRCPTARDGRAVCQPGCAWMACGQIR
jgi:hypothetical protein